MLRNCNIPLATEVCFLVARLRGPEDNVIRFCAAVKSILEDSSCLPQFSPGLLKCLAAIIRAFPGAPDRDLLQNRLAISQTAYLSPLEADDSDEIQHVNNMIAAIFRGREALIFAGRRDAPFLVAHRDDWIRPIYGQLPDFGLILDKESLVRYVLFMQVALQCLPRVSAGNREDSCSTASGLRFRGK